MVPVRACKCDCDGALLTRACFARQGFTERAAAEAAALPSRAAQVLADEVQRAVAEKEEAKKRAAAAGG